MYMHMHMYMCMHMCMHMYACYVNNATRYGVLRGHGLHTLGRTAEPEPM